MREKKEHCSFKMGTFGEGGLFSSSENEKVRSSLFLLCLSGGSDVDISLWVGEEEHDFFSDISDSSWSSSCCFHPRNRGPGAWAVPTLSGAHAVEPIPCWDNLGSETIRAREVGGVQRREGSIP